MDSGIHLAQIASAAVGAIACRLESQLLGVTVDLSLRPMTITHYGNPVTIDVYVQEPSPGCSWLVMIAISC